MSEYELNIAFEEGKKEYSYLLPKNNPYLGVSEVLAKQWDDGYWFEWYKE